VHRLARPPDVAIDWAAGIVGSPIADVQPLTGGMSTGIHLLTTRTGERVVMRRFVNEHWLAIDPHLAPREAAVLQALEATPVPAPSFVGVDPYGELAGAPTVLMGFVPGRRIALEDHRRYASEMAHAMATIHDLAPLRIEGLPDESEQIPRIALEEAPNRHGSRPSPELWSMVRDRLPGVTFGPNTFLHGDFHPGNVLFDGDALSAVIDWPLACSGQPASDVCMCRMDAGMMLGLDVADMILAAYEAETGAALADIGWWDLYASSRADLALESWTESYAGLVEIDLATVTERFEAFVHRALQRADG
jgi:aminoglycoside phosphotransferase (APT) family kinase protein